MIMYDTNKIWYNLKEYQKNTRKFFQVKAHNKNICREKKRIMEKVGESNNASIMLNY